jgi:hypothetical protein
VEVESREVEPCDLSHAFNFVYGTGNFFHFLSILFIKIESPDSPAMQTEVWKQERLGKQPITSPYREHACYRLSFTFTDITATLQSVL